MVKKLEKVTQEEFELSLTETLMAARKILTDTVETCNRYYLVDKDNYRLEFFKQGPTYLYKKYKREKVGFQQK